MKKLLVIGALAAVLSGCEAREIEECRPLMGGRDVNDVRVFLHATGLDCRHFGQSKSLRLQYDHWAQGLVAIDATAANAKREADSAAIMAASAQAMSASASAQAAVNK